MRGLRFPLPVLAALMVVATVALGCASSSNNVGTDTTTTTTIADTEDNATVEQATELSRLSVSGSHIVDANNRQVLLRGANVNALGDYFQQDPDIAPNAPVTLDDWAHMEALGFSVVRLIVSWSAIEPAPGEYDEDYLDSVASTIGDANKHGIYVVLDMHQDAWGKFIATPPDVTCPEGTEAAIGWDGAPEWATITDNESTCRSPGDRESAPAVHAAFRNFYLNTNGIRDSLVNVWGHLAQRFEDNPGIAGYELFNEPNQVSPKAETLEGYNTFVSDSIAAIRSAEAAADLASALIFVEPLILFPLPDTRLDPTRVSDPHVVFAPHNYAESIGPRILTIEQTFEIDSKEAESLRPGASPMPLWIGEFGFWDTAAETIAKAHRLYNELDTYGAGGAWWGWRQTCGDPHVLQHPGADHTVTQYHLITRDCLSDTDVSVTPEFVEVAGRPYGRAIPGSLTEMRFDGTVFFLSATGASIGDMLVVHLPGSQDSDTGFEITATGVTEKFVRPLETSQLVGTTWVGIIDSANYELEATRT